MCLLLCLSSLRSVVAPVKDQMPKLMSGVHAPVLTGLHRVQEDKRRLSSPEREGIDLTGFLGQRKDPDSTRLE